MRYISIPPPPALWPLIINQEKNCVFKDSNVPSKREKKYKDSVIISKWAKFTNFFVLLRVLRKATIPARGFSWNSPGALASLKKTQQCVGYRKKRTTCPGFILDHRLCHKICAFLSCIYFSCILSLLCFFSSSFPFFSAEELKHLDKIIRDFVDSRT